MLVKFRVKNFRSFKDMNEFSMVKGKQRFYEDRISEVDNTKVLKFSAIFGANAAGKSNLIRAMKVMQWIVLNNRVPNDAFEEYFKLDHRCKQLPTYFEMVFTIGEEIFSYGFEIGLSNRIVESEWLFKLHKKNDGSISEKMIFEKQNNNFKFGSSVISDRLLMYKEDIRIMKTSLFLTHVAFNKFVFMQNNNDEIASNILKVFDWFQSSLRVLYTGEALYSPELTSSINEKSIGQLLSYFDTGIKSIELKSCDEYEFRKDIGPIGFDQLSLQNALEQKNRFTPNEKPSFILRTASDIWVIQSENHRLIYKRLYFYHDEDRKDPFRVSNESDGTLRLFELAEALLNNNLDRTIVVDELDRCMHPTLTIQYVKSFLARALKKESRSQLIVTTHESRLMDLDILRRDEIWFVKKDNNESKIYSLEEFNVRFDLIVDKAYLDGRYGGVPVFDSIFFPESIKHENRK